MQKMRRPSRKIQKRVSYDTEFKKQAIALAEELGSVKEASEGLSKLLKLVLSGQVSKLVLTQERSSSPFWF